MWCCRKSGWSLATSLSGSPICCLCPGQERALLNQFALSFLDSFVFQLFLPSEQRLVYLAAQEESAMAESAAASSPQQAEPQAAPLRQPSPG